MYFFSNAYGSSTKIDHILGQRKKNLNKLKRNEITYSTFSDHNRIKLEINNRKT